ncbi:hypothetical protein [Nonomuraea sp. NPDC050783]|uniref:hypothetical protein n=1 Tax=Nonomuraea sp. NPDC050783 TaxID=3154634 RepID=UPI0034667AA1
MFERGTSRPATAAAQLLAVWAVGAVAPLLAWQALLVAAFSGRMEALAAVVLVAASLVLACLILVVSRTRTASRLGAGGGRRVVWALLVLCGGTAGWALGWAATDVAGLGVSRSPLLAALLGGVPFALVAGMLLRGRRFGLTALALSVALAGVAVVLLRRESPDEFPARLAAAGVRGETAYVVAIPGYRPVDDRGYGKGLGSGGFLPADPKAIPPDRHVTITAHDRLVPGERMCGQRNAQDSLLTWGSCEVEPDGLVYRHNEIQHGYQVRAGRRHVTVIGTPAVDRGLLRAAARGLHLATARELGGSGLEQTGDYYAARIPGYRGQPAGAPPGMIYAPADRTGNGARTVMVTLYVTYAAGEDVCFDTVACAPDAGGLTYVRRRDTHGYVIRRGQVNVRVEGGLRTGRALLRQAALDARPATEEELRRALPPPEPHGPVERFRHWLRSF